MEASTAFELKSVSRKFNRLKAVDEVSISVTTGEVVGFVGPSGSGKTTLFRLINSMEWPSEGTISVLGENLMTMSPAKLRKLRARIAVIPQHLGLIPNLRVIQNVLSGRVGGQSVLGSLRNLLAPSKASARKVYDILKRVGIEEKLYERADRLSGGQQQRVVIARALYQEPELILADEPVSSIDPARARNALQLLVKLAKEEGLTLCVSLHNVELARELFPRLIGLRSGKVVFDERTDELSDERFHQLYKLTETELANGE